VQELQSTIGICMYLYILCAVKVSIKACCKKPFLSCCEWKKKQNQLKSVNTCNVLLQN